MDVHRGALTSGGDDLLDEPELTARILAAKPDRNRASRERAGSGILQRLKDLSGDGLLWRGAELDLGSITFSIANCSTSSRVSITLSTSAADTGTTRAPRLG